MTCFRPESNRGPYGLLTFLSAALSTRLVCAVLYVVTFTPLFISSPECAHLLPSTCKLLFMFWHIILHCTFLYCIPHAIIECRMTILISDFPCLAAWFFHVKTARLVRRHHSLPAFRSEITLSARMSVPSSASSPRCTFTLTQKLLSPL